MWSSDRCRQSAEKSHENFVEALQQVYMLRNENATDMDNFRCCTKSQGQQKLFSYGAPGNFKRTSGPPCDADHNALCKSNHHVKY